jgi:hypothetical protein
MKPTLDDLWFFTECLYTPATNVFVYQKNMIEIEPFAGGAVRGFFLDGFIYLTQNPNKNSIYGQMAREGKRIVWVIDNTTGDHLGRIIGDEVEVKVNNKWVSRGKFAPRLTDAVGLQEDSYQAPRLTDC